MLKLNNRQKIYFLKLALKNLNIFKKNIIKKSIVHNKSIKLISRLIIKTKQKTNNFLIRKQCLFSKNQKSISKKSLLSRFILHKLAYSNLNLNFKIYEK